MDGEIYFVKIGDAMTDQSEPREYIVPAEWQINGPLEPGAVVHVVERSAYDELKAEHDRYRTQSETYALELLEVQRERDQLLAQANKLAEALVKTKERLEYISSKSCGDHVNFAGTGWWESGQSIGSAKEALKTWNEWKDKK